MQGKLLISKTGPINCGLLNASNHLNSSSSSSNNNNNSNHHLNHNLNSHQHHNQQQQHNVLTYPVSVNNHNHRLITNGRHHDHKKLDRSISEPVDKLIIQSPINKLNPNQHSNSNMHTSSTTPQHNRSHNGYQRSNSTVVIQTVKSNNVINTTAATTTNNNSSSNNSSNTSTTNGNNANVNSNNNNNNNNTSSRYKTELCRPFEENGTCKYGDKCQFAHGYHELRNLQRHPRYKTVLCRTFHTVGFCPYGPRCHFIHNSEETKKNIMHTLQATSSPTTTTTTAQQTLHRTNSTTITSTTSSATIASLSLSEKINIQNSVIGNGSPDSLLFDDLSQPPPLIFSAILNGALQNAANNVNNNINNINSNNDSKLSSMIGLNGLTGMRPKALSIGSCSLDGSSSGELSQPSTPPSGSPASLSSCFDQSERLHFTPNSLDGCSSLSSNDESNFGTAFTFALNRDALSRCEQEFLSLSLSPRWPF